MKKLIVGDAHVQVKNLKESQNLLDFIKSQALLHSVDRIEFLGDLLHTHAVMRMEAVDFWERNFLSLGSVVPVLALVGNHDLRGNKETEQEMNALSTFKSNRVTIINRPVIIDSIAYIPYMSDEDAFVKAAQELYNQGAIKLLIAHQNFTVPLYHDIIDPSLIPQESIVTGHIHEHKQIGKVFQPGTPKWDTLTDANEDKGIWITTHAADGSIVTKEFISTKDVVTPITKTTLNEGDLEIELNPNARNYLELVGSSAWINQIKKKYKGVAQIKARPLDRKSANINKDKASSMLDYLESSFKPIDGVSKSDIKQYLQEVVNV